MATIPRHMIPKPLSNRVVNGAESQPRTNRVLSTDSPAYDSPTAPPPPSPACGSKKEKDRQHPLRPSNTAVERSRSIYVLISAAMGSLECTFPPATHLYKQCRPRTKLSKRRGGGPAMTPLVLETPMARTHEPLLSYYTLFFNSYFSAYVHPRVFMMSAVAEPILAPSPPQQHFITEIPKVHLNDAAPL